jgi:hypothetical protein
MSQRGPSRGSARNQSRHRAIPLALQRRMIAESECADVVELDTDHTPHLSRTGELAEALQRFAMHSLVA